MLNYEIEDSTEIMLNFEAYIQHPPFYLKFVDIFVVFVVVVLPAVKV